MSRDTIVNIIARVQKLRELAGNNANANEAANAAAAAASLIDRFQLSEMDLAVKEGKDQEPIEEIAEPLFKTGRTMLWVSVLANGLCEHYGCTGYLNTIRDAMEVSSKNPNAIRDSYKAFKIIGRKGDAEIVRYMFTWLQPVIIDLMKRNSYGKGMRHSQNYALGVVQGIKNQLALEHKKVVAEAAASNQSQAMVLLDSRTALSKDHMKKTVEGLHDRKSYLGSDREARDRGIRAGENIRLSKGMGPGGSDPKKLR